jgi:hypothetical protein
VVNSMPSSELVLVQWLKTLSGLPGVSTTLPDQETWYSTGFITVVGVGGSMDYYQHRYSAVLSVDAWAAPLSAGRPDWSSASRLAELVVKNFYDSPNLRLVDVPTGYYDAYLHSLYALTPPRRITNDPEGFAHISMDVQMNWGPARTGA